MSNDPTHPFTFLHTITTPVYEKGWFAIVLENEIFGIVCVALVALVVAIRFQGRWYQRLVVAAITIAGGVFSMWLMEMLHIMRIAGVPVALTSLCAIGFAYMADKLLHSILQQKEKTLDSTFRAWSLKAFFCAAVSLILLWITIYTLPVAAILAYSLYLQWPREKLPPNPEEEAKKFDALLLRADKGEAAAQFQLGKMYQTGAGVEISEIGALIWYQKAAAQGHAEAKRCVTEIESRMAGWKPETKGT